MVTIAHVVEKIIRDEPYLEYAVGKEIISYAKLATYLEPKIEKELGRAVKHGAVVMALTRLSEKLQQHGYRDISRGSLKEVEISIRSDIDEITIVKSPKSFEKIRKLYGTVDFASGDIFNVIQGNYEITIIASRKYTDMFEKEMRGEQKVKKIRGLSSLSLKFPLKLVQTPGFFALVTNELSWHNINIIEMVSTLTELTLVINNGQITKAYDVLHSLFKTQE